MLLFPLAARSFPLQTAIGSYLTTTRICETIVDRCNSNSGCNGFWYLPLSQTALKSVNLVSMAASVLCPEAFPWTGSSDLATVYKAPITQYDKHPWDGYDCSNKEDGNYVHPTDCTRFARCEDGVASEIDCPPCNVDPVRCPEGRLVSNATVDSCLRADETECESE